MKRQHKFPNNLGLDNELDGITKFVDVIAGRIVKVLPPVRNEPENAKFRIKQPDGTYKTYTKVDGQYREETGTAGPAGQGVPIGGTAGQHLAKIDGTDYNAEWVTPSTGSGDMTKAVYDIDDNGIVDKSESVDDGAGNSKTAAQIKSHIDSTSNPHSVTKTQVSLGNVTDDSQLKRAAGDFASFTEKVSPVAADLLLIEDSEAAGVKKKVQIGSLPLGASELSDLSDVDLTGLADGQILVFNDGTGNFEPAEPSAAAGAVSGIYTPTLTNVTNLDSSTAYQCQYLRVGSVVTVSGKLLLNPTAAGQVELRISLPVASDFDNESNCAGTVFAPGIAGQGAAILADLTNGEALLEFIAVDTTEQAMYFHFTYLVQTIPPAAYCDEALALFARMVVEPDETRKGLIDDLIVDLIAAGIWAKLDCMYMFAAHTQQAAFLNWIKNAHDCTSHGTTIFTTDDNIKSNATDGYLNTNYDPSTQGVNYLLDSASIGVAVADFTSAGKWCIGAIYSTNDGETGLGFDIAFGFSIADINSAGNFGAALTPKYGFLSSSRFSSTQTRRVHNLGSEVVSNVNSNTLTNRQFDIMSRRNSTGHVGYNDAKHRFAYIGGALTESEIQTLHTKVEVYLDALSVGVM